MLAEFIKSHRDSVITRTRSRVIARSSRAPSEAELHHGIPVFLDQLVDALMTSRASDIIDHDAIKATARRNGRELLGAGLTIGQVVHHYGDVCQVVTELAVGIGARIPATDFRTMNLCLDDAIAEAVAAYSQDTELAIAAVGNERLGVLAHELRNLLNIATLSFEHIKSGLVAVSGSTGQLHARSLLGLRDLIDRSLADVRLDAGMGRQDEIAVATLLAEIEIGGAIQAQGREITLWVTAVEHGVVIRGDRQLIAAALANLLQNAFKFTHRRGRVTLRTRVTGDRVMFDVEDECGGLPPGAAEDLFRPFEQRGADRSGVGLGLSICRKTAETSGGELRVRDVPGKGCVFTLDLPRA